MSSSQGRSVGSKLENSTHAALIGSLLVLFGVTGTGAGIAIAAMLAALGVIEKFWLWGWIAKKCAAYKSAFMSHGMELLNECCEVGLMLQSAVLLVLTVIGSALKRTFLFAINWRPDRQWWGLRMFHCIAGANITLTISSLSSMLDETTPKELHLLGLHASNNAAIAGIIVGFILSLVTSWDWSEEKFERNRYMDLRASAFNPLTLGFMVSTSPYVCCAASAIKGFGAHCWTVAKPYLETVGVGLVALIGISFALFVMYWLILGIRSVGVILTYLVVDLLIPAGIKKSIASYRSFAGNMYAVEIVPAVLGVLGAMATNAVWTSAIIAIWLTALGHVAHLREMARRECEAFNVK